MPKTIEPIRTLMAPSLSLTSYLTLARREPLSYEPKLLPQAGSALIWLHCSDPERALELVQLGQRLAAQRTKAQLLLTLSADVTAPAGLPDEVILDHPPSENPKDVSKFLNHWQPACLIWVGPGLRPSLLHGAQKQGFPSVLVDADELKIEGKTRWLPDSLRATLQLFTRIYARDAASGFRIRRMVGMYGPVEDSGALQENSPALACSETDLEDLGEALKGRPVWLASRVQTGELDAVLAAHKASIKLSPRMLLIIVPDDPLDAGAALTACEEGGWRVALWDNGEMPDEKAHILLAEDAAELGVFYRIAPMSFVGSSLISGQGGRDPFEAAALGSAVLYGPGVRNYLEAYSRLAQAGAARIVKDANSLSAAVAGLLAPDKVAKMVHAGWEVISEGALVTDRIVDHLNDAMDERGSP
ncbi:3-deoxy-D-manno-octulosonic acid transferase [Cognatishimia activa]|uniref:3-deoxy-D-manno-octulosonic acid transferase n=1 Tax=Cognatishimia activa TaxID=1715691 RepID=A0A0P1IRT5_9RHOB|nr:3-deoxy-D-manno-octulosonic acid transferase [Cognatishimia activa]CUK24414.1 3-deoxy-D-manno-octulosonic acid transferase [Cognatishimia activa]